MYTHWEDLSTAIMLIDLHTNEIVYVNAACEQLFAHSKKILHQYNFYHWFHHHDEIKHLQHQLLNQKTDQFRLVTQIIAAEQQTLLILLSGKILPNNHQLILFELTELSQPLKAERTQQLIAQNQRQQEFVRVLAHEIKNPLGGIRGAAQLLALENLSEDLNECTQIIIKETDRLRNLLNRLLSPQESQFRPEKINIHEPCEHVLGLLAIQYPNIKLIRDYDISLPEIHADRQQLIQILLNLGLNAAQALQEAQQKDEHFRAKITFKTRVDRQVTLQQVLHPLVLLISIQDNGIGIDEALQPHLFHPLISNKQEGTGLGLSIAQSLAQQHRGNLTYHTQPGSTQFMLYLPF